MSCCTDCKPNLIRGSLAIHGLQHEVETERELKFANDYYRRLVSTQCDQIAAADLALDGIAQGFEEALDGSVKAK